MKNKIKEQILETLKNTYCRLRASRVSGVGIFAVRDIPKNKNPFEMIKKTKWQEFNVADLKKLDKGVLKMIDDFCVIEEDGKVLVPECGLNGMDISFFLNHSNRPNVRTIDEGFTFLTQRVIKKGEELTVSYGTYDWKYK